MLLGVVKALCVSALVCLPGGAAWAEIAPPVHVEHGANGAAAIESHYVVLVSLDGFRWDYARKYGAKHLLAMAKEGVSAPGGMEPSYPSVTFPNHYTLVTGLYPEHHGIVAMRFYDPARRQFYAYDDPGTATDGSWYGGVPLWSLAEKQGMRSACFFWPGSEAEIAGERPTYFMKFDDSYPDTKRIDQVMAWLGMPAEVRPHLITLYYSNVDRAGHKFGPETPQTRDAVLQVDALMGDLEARLKKSRLPVDLVVVSDHGMIAERGGWIDLDRYADLSHFVKVGNLIYAEGEDAQREKETERVYQALKSATGAFKVYRRAKAPAELEYNGNARAGDPIVVAIGPFAIRAQAPADAGKDFPPNKGSHGFDVSEMPEMRAIFYAVGPDFRQGMELRPFENVHVYPLLAHILRLDAPATDGKLSVLGGALREGAAGDR